MDDEAYYAKVVDELSLSGPIPGLWAKAFSECDGNEPRAKALYMRLRVAQLVAESLIAHEREVAQERLREEQEEMQRVASGLPPKPRDGDISIQFALLAMFVVAVISIAFGFAIKR